MSGGGRGATTATTPDDEMYPMNTLIAEPILMPATQSLQEYVAASGKHIRTVKQWLAEGLLPGASQDPVTGRWRIPVGAGGPAPTQQSLAPRPAEPTAVTTAPRPAGLDWDAMPTFLTLEQAARLLHPVTEYAITADPKYFRAVKKGHKGAWLVPLARVKKFRGIK